MQRTWAEPEREPQRPAPVFEPPAHALLELQRQAVDKQKMSPVDRALATEAARGATASTESLAHAQGFIAGFGLEKAGIELADRPISEELRKLAEHWVYAADPVKAETISRLKTYAAGLTDKERRATFRATLQELKAGDKALAKLADPLLAVLK
jgi:hypothetical protein